MPRLRGGLPIRFDRPPKCFGPLLLYTLISLGLLGPYRYLAVRWSGDMKTVLALVIEARRALAEGQFPIRVAPDLQNGARYPQFQYYGNFPFTVAGAVSAICGDKPYLAWKIVTLASLISGGCFMRKLAYALFRNDPAATMAGAVFLCAPYLLTDLYARVAFTELIAVNLLPAAFYLSIRCFRSPRPRYIVGSAVAWGLIALSHNITYLYGILFLALFLLSQVTGPRRVRRLGRLALAGLLHGALVIWYVAPQLATVDLTEIWSVFTPQFYAGLTPLRVLLSPTLLNTPQGQETPNLGLQIGWPILVLALVALLVGWRQPARRPLLMRLFILWALAFFIAWSPFDFWNHVPRAFWFVQFPYRLLMFVVLFGAILSACALAALFPRRLPAWTAVALLGLLGLSIASFYPRGQVPLYGQLTRQLQADPNLSRLKEFVPKAEALTVASEEAGVPADAGFPPLVRTDRLRSAALQAWQLHYGRVTWCDFAAQSPTVLAIPVLDYPGLLDVRVDRQKTPYGNSGRFIAIKVPAGLHHISVRFTGYYSANVISLIAWVAVLLAILVAGTRHWIRLAATRGGALCQVWRLTDTGSRRASSERSSSLSPRTILAGFAAMMLCVVVPDSNLVRRLFRSAPEISASADHFTWDGLPEYAFDGLPQTAWMAGTGQPTHLTARFSRPARLHGIELNPRLGSLYEGWRHVRITLFDGEQKIFERSFDFPNAGRNRQQIIEFPSMQASRVEFEFSGPVDQRNDGSRIPESELMPGYAEIRFFWN